MRESTGGYTVAVSEVPDRLAEPIPDPALNPHRLGPRAFRGTPTQEAGMVLPPESRPRGANLMSGTNAGETPLVARAENPEDSGHIAAQMAAAEVESAAPLLGEATPPDDGFRPVLSEQSVAPSGIESEEQVHDADIDGGPAAAEASGLPGSDKPESHLNIETSAAVGVTPIRLRLIADPVRFAETKGIVAALEQGVRVALDSGNLNNYAHELLEDELLPLIKELMLFLETQPASAEERVRAATEGVRLAAKIEQGLNDVRRVLAVGTGTVKDMMFLGFIGCEAYQRLPDVARSFMDHF